MIAPTINRSAIEQAAFWEEAVCLNCSNTNQDADQLVCPVCEERMYPGTELLELINTISETDEQRGDLQ